ncbi:hypothetical protein GE061_000469 [Apolygus lucorum]|uniref:Uncharacterized protein n=1 Tax=Apolygus lucorum TaxID=248454 RepID=A0A8S9Y6C1_APOLU|nr:hypothetical protein GE061_000469 [Apolygus lucorum]
MIAEMTVGDWSGKSDDNTDTNERQLDSKTDYETEINELMHNYGLASFDEVKDRLWEFHEWDFMRRMGQIIGSKTNPMFSQTECTTTERVPITWELWASNPKNIGVGPAARVGNLIDNLRRKVIDPLLRGYSELVNKLMYHRKISSGITRISSSMDQIDRIVEMFEGGALQAEVEDDSSKVIAMGLVRLEQALLAKFDTLSAKVDNVVDKTDRVQGRLEKVVHEDITSLGRKMDVLSYKQKEVAENTAALGESRVLPRLLSTR